MANTKKSEAAGSLFYAADKRDFKRQFVVQFLACYCASNFRDMCSSGRQSTLEKPPVEDAEFLAEAAWRHWNDIMPTSCSSERLLDHRPARKEVFRPYKGEDGDGWGVENESGYIEYEAVREFDENTAQLMVQILNEGRGLDGWCESDNPNADLLRDRMIERGWIPPEGSDRG